MLAILRALLGLQSTRIFLIIHPRVGDKMHALCSFLLSIQSLFDIVSDYSVS